MKKNIIFGMPTLIECTSIIDTIKLCKELNLSFIELNMNLPQYQIDSIDKKLLKKIKEEEKIFFTIHLDENINVCDFNSKVAAAYVDTTLEAIKLAKELEIPILNMHMAEGVYFTLPDKKVYLFDEYEERYMSHLKNFRDVCAKEIGDSNIKICIENTDGYKSYMLDGIKLLLESDVFDLTWDIGHEHASNYKDMKFILENSNRLIHMHIHDAKGEKNHLVLGSGEINLQERFKVAKDNECRCVIETKTVDALEKSVEYLKIHGLI